MMIERAKLDPLLLIGCFNRSMHNNAQAYHVQDLPQNKHAKHFKHCRPRLRPFDLLMSALPLLTLAANTAQVRDENPNPRYERKNLH